MKATVLGASGFIGRHLARTLAEQGHDVATPARGDDVFQRPLNHVWYCIGLTADFRQRPLDTVDAHVCLLRRILEHAEYDSLIYLSSTRVYAGSASAEETQALTVCPGSPDHLYNLSKLMGENLTLAAGRNSRVARLSNVLGPDMGLDNFVGSVLDEAARTGSVRFRTALESNKDYVWIDDVVAGLIALAGAGAAPITNLAGGRNVTHAELADWLRARNVSVSVEADAPTSTFPTIAIDRQCGLLGREPVPALQRMAEWYDVTRSSPASQMETAPK